MAFFVDFSKYKYKNRQEENTVNIGWIEGTKDYCTGEVTKEFLLYLWEYMKFPFYQTRGIYHNITLDGENAMFIAVFDGYEIPMGSYEIRVIDKLNNLVYAAPDLILHYIINHHYLPPKEFIEAVKNGPKPNSKEYNLYVHNIFMNKSSQGGKKLSCPLCGNRHIYFAPKKKKVFKKNADIVILNSLEVEQKKKDYNDYIFYGICENCGRLFEFENNILKKKLNL